MKKILFVLIAFCYGNAYAATNEIVGTVPEKCLAVYDLDENRHVIEEKQLSPDPAAKQ
jgi:hypothetical protein